MSLHLPQNWRKFVSDAFDLAQSAYSGEQLLLIIKKREFQSRNATLKCIGCGVGVVYPLWKILDRHYGKKEESPMEFTYECKCKQGNQGSRSLAFHKFD